MIKNNAFIICFIFLITKTFSEVDVKNINENTQLKFPLKKNIYFSSSIFINDKEYELPIDMSWDRTWINTDIISKNHNKELVIEDCPIYELEFKSKKNIPISFFDKNLILEDISYDELTSNLNDKNCDTKNGLISLSPRSDKKVLNLLTQLNNAYSIKKYFTIYNNELIIGNFDEEIKKKKHIVSHILDSENKWKINIQGVYFGDTDNKGNNEFTINVMNNNYKKFYFSVEFNCLQRMILVEYFSFESINTKIFKNKCNIKLNEEEKFEGIYCNKNIIDKLPNIGLMINDKLLPIKINKLFIKDKNNPDEMLFLIGFAEIVWEKGPCLVGSAFFNELGIKTIFDAENSNIYFLSDDIIENIKIVDDYSVDDKQVILNNNSLSLYDFILCFILISNFFGIIILVASLYKEKFLGKMQNHIKKIKRMNKQ